MVPRCEPLCCFDDRLYFTTFTHPAPDPQILNVQGAPRPKVRSKNYHGARAVPPDDGSPYYFFTIDDQLVYLSFFQDWGPLNLAMVYKACILFHELLQDEELAGHRLVLYSSDDPRRKANAALLMALYAMIVLRRPPWEAFHPIAEIEFMPFRDAGRGPSDFNLSIQDCLWGMWKAMQNGLCDMNEFSVEEYEYYEKVENGDWNWLTPNFVAFASPVDPDWIKAEKERKAAGEEEGGGVEHKRAKRTSTSALRRKLPQPFLNCLDQFEKKNVRLVVRLNTELYDRQAFLDHGIDHVELYFDDGTNPTDEITRTFIDMADEVINAGGAVAVHCKAGLGRTGTLIGAYMIWKYGFTANEAIAFMRIVRPGTVVGPQQHFMYLKQLEWTKWAAADEIRRRETTSSAASAPPVVTPATPPAEEPDALDADEAGAMAVDTAGAEPPEPPSTPPPAHLPPVTPSRHVAAAQAKARAITPPGQPRKTPMAKRVPVESDDEASAPLPSVVTAAAAKIDNDMEEDEEADALPALGGAPPAASSSVAMTATTSSAAKTAPKYKARGTVSARAKGVTASERTTRVTRSALAGPSARKPPAPVSPIKPAPAPAAASSSTAAAAPPASPNKIPRLTTQQSTTTGAVTRAKAAAAAGPSSRRVPPPPPTPSRLPTLAAKRHNTTNSVSGAVVASKEMSEAANNIGKKGQRKDDWMAQGKGAVVVPANKSSSRPGLRPIRRRRSSFSAADVVA